MSSQRRMKPVGDQELALLHFVGDCGQVSVGEAAERFGQPRGLARSTVLTMMERLRRKRLRVRRRDKGVYRYRTKTSPESLLKNAVRRFVEGPLGGSVTPLAAYLTEAHDVSDEELQELQEAVNRLRSERRKGR